MRSFKFRIWSLEEKKFVEGLFISPEDGSIYDPVGDSFPEGYIINQFTGLLDGNGKEIYEGDIFTFGENNNYFVEYKNDRFWLSQYVGLNNNYEESSDGYYRLCLPAYTRDREIIGNIYEYPELMENK